MIPALAPRPARAHAAVEVVGLVEGRCRPFRREVLEVLGHEVAPERAPHVPVQSRRDRASRSSARRRRPRRRRGQGSGRRRDLPIADEHVAVVTDRSPGPSTAPGRPEDSCRAEVIWSCEAFWSRSCRPVGASRRSDSEADEVRERLWVGAERPGSPGPDDGPPSPSTATRSATASARSTFCSASSTVWPRVLQRRGCVSRTGRSRPARAPRTARPEQQAGVGHERTGDREHLLLAAGQRPARWPDRSASRGNSSNTERRPTAAAPARPGRCARFSRP